MHTLLMVVFGLAMLCWMHDIKLLVERKITQADFLIDTFLLVLIIVLYLMGVHNGDATQTT